MGRVHLHQKKWSGGTLIRVAIRIDGEPVRGPAPTPRERRRRTRSRTPTDVGSMLDEYRLPALDRRGQLPSSGYLLSVEQLVKGASRGDFTSTTICSSRPNDKAAAAARAVCSNFKVQPDCLDYARVDSDMMGWGGTSERTTS